MGATTVTSVTTTTTATTATTSTETSVTTTTTVTAQCKAGQYLDVAINLCTGCPEGQYQDEDTGHSFTKCMMVKQCVAADGQTEKDAPSLTMQRTCWALPGQNCSTAPTLLQYEKLSEEISDAAASG